MKMKLGDLWEGEAGPSVEPEVPAEVAGPDLCRVADEVASAEDAGARRDKGDAELEDDVADVHDVGYGTKEGEGADDVPVHGDAAVAADVEDVEVEGIGEEGDEAGEEEDAVPSGDDSAAGVEDAPGLPRALPAYAGAQLDQVGEAGEVERRCVVAEREGRRRR